MSKRDIKFRGKRIEDGKWIYGDLYHTCELTCICDWSIRPHTVEEFEVAPDTVGQFTGLYDKDEKEIFEGDIVLQRGYNSIKPMVVRFEQGAFIVGWHGGSSTAIRPMLIQKRCEVLGNIHDNPEMLKGGNG